MHNYDKFNIDILNAPNSPPAKLTPVHATVPARCATETNEKMANATNNMRELLICVWLIIMLIKINPNNYAEDIIHKRLI